MSRFSISTSVGTKKPCGDRFSRFAISSLASRSRPAWLQSPVAAALIARMRLYPRKSVSLIPSFVGSACLAGSLAIGMNCVRTCAASILALSRVASVIATSSVVRNKAMSAEASAFSMASAAICTASQAVLYSFLNSLILNSPF